MLFGMNDSVQEGFYTFNENSKTDSDIGIKALDLSGLDVSSGTGGNIEANTALLEELMTTCIVYMATLNVLLVTLLVSKM